MEEPAKKKQRIENEDDEDDIIIEIERCQTSLLAQCLCNIPESSLRRPFTATTVASPNGEYQNACLSEWEPDKTLKFISVLQLLFDAAIRQSTKHVMCSRIAEVCVALARNEHGIMDQIIDLSCTPNQFISFSASRALASFFIVTRENIDAGWLERVTQSLLNTHSPSQMLFTLDVIKRVVEHRDDSIHPMDDAEHSGPSVHCNTLEIDPGSQDSTPVKEIWVKVLKTNWTILVNKFDTIFTNYSPQHESTVIIFLELWKSLIFVEANLSVIETKFFLSQLGIMVIHLNASVPGVVWRHLLRLFNEVLCYGNTLSLQDILSDEPYSIAHLIIHAVKDRRLLDALPLRQGSGRFDGGFGTGDRLLLRQIVLLVLKSVAVTVRETRSDSSDSSLESGAKDIDADMAVIERSIREVLRQLDHCIKALLPFDPEMPLSEWIIQVFHDQDDLLVESMLCCLDTAIILFYRGPPPPQYDLGRMLSPTRIFVQFVQAIAHDPNVLLDLLHDSETCFSLYLLRFLKYIKKNWSEFVTCCAGDLDNTMTVLIRLRLSMIKIVTKNLLAYNISPILRLLGKCVSIYKGNVEN